MVNIGKYDRGIFDKEDNIKAKETPLKNKLNAKETEDLARKTPGSELIIKEDDDTYSIYQLDISENQKKILNSDFVNDNISLSGDISKKFSSGKKAYIMTDDNVLRTMEIKGIDLIGLEKEFVSFSLSSKLEDLDGIETKSKNDIIGNISGNIKIDKKFLEYLLAQSEKDMNIKAELLYDSSSNKYTINLSKGVNIGNIELKMNNSSIDLSVNSSFTVNLLEGAINYNPVNMIAGNKIDAEGIIKNIIQEYLSKEIGLKVTDRKSNSLKLEPDFANGSLIKSIPIGDMNIKLEEINSDKSKTSFNIDNSGNLLINLSARIIGSSDTKAVKLTKKDEEGSDIFNTKVKGKLINDFSLDIESNSELELKVNNEEKTELSKRIKNISSRDIGLEGEIEIKDIKTKLKIDSNGSIKLGESTSGSIKGKNINIDLGNASIGVNSSNGDFNLENTKDRAILNVNNIEFNSEIKSNDFFVNINNAKLDGSIKYDKSNPNKILIESKKDKGFEFSLDIKDKSENKLLSVKDFELKGLKSEIDFKNGDISLKQVENNSLAKISNLKIGNDIDISNLNFQGNLKANVKDKSINIDAKNIELNGKLGNIHLNNFKASGKIDYNPKNGIKIEDLNLQNASGKIGNFDISKMSGKANLSFDSKGNLDLASVSDFTLNSDFGLKLKGDFIVSQKDGVFNLNTNYKKSINLNYKPKDKEENIATGLLLDGNIKYNSNDNTFSFNNHNSPLRIQRGNIAGTSFNNFKMEGEIHLLEDGNIKLYNSKGNIKLLGGIGNLNLKEFSSNGEILYNPNDNSLKSIGKLNINIQNKNLNLSADGDISIIQTKEGKYILSGKDIIVNAKIGNIDLKNTKINGSIEIDPNTGKLSFGGEKDFSIEGNLQGKDFNFKTNGKFSFNPEKNGNTILSSEGFKFDGNIEGLNIKSKEGLNANLNLDDKGNISSIKDFDFNFELEGIKFENIGEMNSSDKEYNIKLDGKIASDPAKINELLQKIASNPLLPEAYKDTINKINEKISGIDIKAINYNDLNIKLDKNYNFENIQFTVNNTDIKLPNKNINIKTDGELKFGFDKNNNFLLESNGARINANIETIKLDDMFINGRIVYDNTKLSMEGISGKELEIKGKINENHQIDLKSKGKIDINRTKEGLEFSGEDININGNLDGFNVKTLKGASGKILFNDNGKLDISNLKFALKIDDIELNNTDGSVHPNSEDGYNIKFSGNISTSQEKLINFLDKISKNSVINEYTRKTIKETVDNIRNYMVYGDIKKAEYKDFTIRLDKDLAYKGFNASIDAKMEKTTIKTGIRNTKDIMDLGNVDIKANIISEENSFNIKNGNISFNLTPQVRESMKNAFTSVLKTFNLKDIDLAIEEDGSINLKRAIYDDIPITDVEIATKIKIEDKKIIVNLEKAELQGFLGKIAQSIIDSTKEGGVKKMGIEETLKKITDMKINYKGENNKFYIDLSDILYQYISEDIKLNDIKMENEKFSLLFEAEVNNNKKPFSPAEVNKEISEIKKLLGSSNENDRNKLKNIILNSKPENLTRVLDHINLYSLKETLKDEQNIIDILKKLSYSQDLGKNSEHLEEISTFVNDNIALGLERQIDKKYLLDISPNTKYNFIKYLADGHTNGNEEKAIKSYIINSKAFDLSVLLTKINEDLIKSELEDSDYQDILLKIAKSSGVHFNDNHFNRFIKKADAEMIVSLIKQLSNNDVSKINSEGKKLMINILRQGNTNDEKQKTISKIINSSNNTKLQN